MSIIRADSIKNRSGLGAPDFPNGITVTGIVTATTLNQNVTGIVTATSFVGDGSSLTGIDATALKDGSGNVIVQAGSLDVVVGAGKTFKHASTNSTD